MSLGIIIHQYSKHLPALIVSIDVDPFNNICTDITEVDDNNYNIKDKDIIL